MEIVISLVTVVVSALVSWIVAKQTTAAQMKQWNEERTRPFRESEIEVYADLREIATRMTEWVLQRKDSATDPVAHSYAFDVLWGEFERARDRADQFGPRHESSVVSSADDVLNKFRDYANAVDDNGDPVMAAHRAFTDAVKRMADEIKARVHSIRFDGAL